MMRIQSFWNQAFVASLLVCVCLLPHGVASAQNDRLANYLSLRQQTTDDQAGHLALARFAKTQGLTEQARAHLLRLLNFDPENERVRRELGHVNLNGRWSTKEQVDDLATEHHRQLQLYRKWLGPVTKATKQLTSTRLPNQQRGQEMLAAIDDPDATYAIEHCLCSLPTPQSAAGIHKLHRFDGVDATEALLRVAVYHNDPTARQLATELLNQRETAEFIPNLVEMLESPVVSQFVVSRVGFGQLLHRHVFVQQRFDQDVIRQYDQMHAAILMNPRQRMATNGDVNRVLNENRRNAAASMQQMEQAREVYNLSIEQQNSRIMFVLRQITGQDAGPTPDAWWTWWYDQNDFSYYQRPVSYRAQSLPTSLTTGEVMGSSGTVTWGTAGGSGDCFVAGTVAWTERGRLPIETLRTGDRVLSRDLRTNQLVYRNVITSTIREATQTLQIQLPNETLRVSGGHPLHVDGEGWVRVRDLKPGMALTGRESPVVIQAISPGATEVLYNLVVERDSNFYVGQQGVLSHDHSIPATRTVVPKPVQ
ncbi:MAG: Hint domain-containing protein [Planctomycetaceae bacterium]|nr:Hint domain-containing protein [Planctomycetaceae bacterium]